MNTIGSLFTGGGGWEAGAAEVGLRPLFGVEMDPAVAATMLRSFV
jgi:site-specific DNA-cytosine methylase